MKLKLMMSSAVASLAVLTISCSRQADPAIPQDAQVEKKVENVLSSMSLEDKAGQLVQITVSEICTDGKLDTAKVRAMVRRYRVGSFLNVFDDVSQTRELTAKYVSDIQNICVEELGIPTVFGLDMIHGATYLTDGTFFPQEINLAATFERSFASEMGRIMAYETRAAMVPWIFSPVMDLGRDPRWPRHWESWGEDPYLQSEMSEAETVAAQGEDPNHIDLDHVAVSIKHYLGYGAPVTGQDRTPAVIAPGDLKEKYFKPFKACLKAGALTLMANSASINGVPVHSSHEYLTEWAKEQLGWDGMIVTDWADINNLFTREHIAADRKEALEIGINAGIDMIMDPYDPTVCDDIVELVKEGRISRARLDDAVRRVLRLKVRLGLFENPVWSVDGYDEFASESFREKAYQAAVESIVLLKNEGGILPLEQGKRILVTGPNANSMRTLNGGWSYSWQGHRADEFAGDYNTIYEALRDRFGSDMVEYVPGVVYSGYNWQSEAVLDLRAVSKAVSRADVVVVCVGENSYCETPGNINDLNLSGNQKSLVKMVAAYDKPVIMVLNEGRPRIINDIEPNVDAVIDVMLPGNFGGDALAALVSGDENFSGKLPFTYSKYVNALHTYDYKVSENVQTMEGMYNYDAVMDVQWPFGHGLSYTEFEYSDLKAVSGSSFVSGDVLAFEVTVKNTGDRKGKESVLLYSSDLVASVVPDVKRLRQFTKIELEPGESRTVRLEFPADELAFVGRDGKWRLEAGQFRISCGGQSLVVECGQTKIWAD
ncbi:MAG: glycoside hydrolase family 3 N-terminal domain-containing protein [Candidatus Cryptobacteroides sp.]|nr:glycoside hydrolase family 3 N-terminal domain-containing protein [Candidatus Cryptobacteroides sp.]